MTRLVLAYTGVWFAFRLLTAAARTLPAWAPVGAHLRHLTTNSPLSGRSLRTWITLATREAALSGPALEPEHLNRLAAQMAERQRGRP